MCMESRASRSITSLSALPFFAIAAQETNLHALYRRRPGMCILERIDLLLAASYSLNDQVVCFDSDAFVLMTPESRVGSLVFLLVL